MADNNEADATMPPPEDKESQSTSFPTKEDATMKESEGNKSPEKENENEKNDTPSNTDNKDDVVMPPKEKEEPHSFTVEKDTAMKESEDDSKEETKEGEKKNQSKPASTTLPTELPPRPIKKARSAYFIFADEKRAEITARVSIIWVC